MRVPAGQVGEVGRGAVPLLAVFLVGVAVGFIIDRDDNGDGDDDVSAVWSEVVRVDGEPVATELFPEGDGYELCVTPPGAPRDTCVKVTDSNGIDARLEPSSIGDLFIVLSGSDRPLDLVDQVEVPLGPRGVHGALVAVDMTGDCVTFSVTDPTGGTDHQMSIHRTVHGGDGDADGVGVTVPAEVATAATDEGNGPSCHRLN